MLTMYKRAKAKAHVDDPQYWPFKNIIPPFIPSNAQNARFFMFLLEYTVGGVSLALQLLQELAKKYSGAGRPDEKAAAVIPYDPEDTAYDPSTVTSLKSLLQLHPNSVLLLGIKKLLEGDFDVEIHKTFLAKNSNMMVPKSGDTIGVFPAGMRESFSNIINSATQIKSGEQRKIDLAIEKRKT